MYDIDLLHSFRLVAGFPHFIANSGSTVCPNGVPFPDWFSARGGMVEVDAHEWLSTHSNKLLRNTIYRTTYYKSLLSGEDWMLERAHEIAMHGTKPLKIV